MTGWIKIHREITAHWIFQDAEKFKWWIDLLIMASHEDYKVLTKDTLVSLKRGQLSVSLSFLASRWGRSKEKVLNFLRLLESDHMIEKYSDRKSTTITICNYDSYQDVTEQTPTTNPTDTRPISDQSPTEYKNVEECKEINNNNLNAHTREERISWDSGRERGFGEQVKASQIMALGRKFSLNRTQMIQYIEAFLDKCQIGDHGHRDIGHFGNHLSNFIEDEIKKPKPIEQPKAKRVIEGKEIFNLYR